MAAESAVGFLLENVKELALYYADLLNKEKAKDDQEELDHTLQLLKSILEVEGAADKPKNPDSFKIMESWIRGVVYEVEDIIDSCYCHAIEHNAKEKLQRIVTRINLAEQVKLAKEKVIMTLNRARSELENMPFADPLQIAVAQKLKSAPSLRHENVVVLQDQVDKVYEFLKDTKNDKLGVFSIVGMPGLGKSTLAWKIFQSEKVKVKFPIRMWIYVSQEFNRREVLLKILKEIDSSNSYDSLETDANLELKVRDFLQDSTFLLVLDDVWNSEDWEKIKNMLPQSNSKGKVVITTRRTDAGQAACSHSRRSVHQLRSLEHPESWELLQYEVFGKLDAYPSQLKDVGYKIATECEGLPLAIVVTGGILKQQYNPEHIPQTITKWNDVSNNVSEHLKADKAKHLVGLSYSTLSAELKHCLVYLGVFPKGLEIPVSTLTRLWVAEGFIQQKDRQTPEERAQENLDDLINRNLVMVPTRNLFGEVKKCRVHDVIREFCTTEADIHEKNLFREIKKLPSGDFSPSVDQIHKHRRLCIHTHLQDLLSKKLQGTSVARSFLCFNKDPFTLETKYNPSIPKNFKLLRVLDSACFKFAVFPKVKELNHLRYLTLSCDTDELPSDISSNLWNLRTLILHTNKSELKLKANIWKMDQLRHLKTKAAIVLPTDNRGVAGKKLHTLTRLSAQNCKQDVFDKAQNLKILGIRGSIDDLLKVQFSTGTLSSLENLKVQNDSANPASSKPPLSDFPKFFPPTLKKLTLSKTNFDWMNMSAVARIYSLEVLKLKDYAFNGDSWKSDSYIFHSLQFLHIARTDLSSWEANPEQFPSLWYLSLKKCEKLLKIPLCLAKTPLRNLDLEHVHSSAAECARKIKEEKDATPGKFKLTIIVAPSPGHP